MTMKLHYEDENGSIKVEGNLSCLEFNQVMTMIHVRNEQTLREREEREKCFTSRPF